ncbi:MAG: hypothetical protein Kow00100_24030 [Geothermobacteraceae bacterium]
MSRQKAPKQEKAPSRGRIPWLVLLGMLLVAGMLLTLWFGRGSRHGYGLLTIPEDHGAPLRTG